MDLSKTKDPAEKKQSRSYSDKKNSKRRQSILNEPTEPVSSKKESESCVFNKKEESISQSANNNKKTDHPKSPDGNDQARRSNPLKNTGNQDKNCEVINTDKKFALNSIEDVECSEKIVKVQKSILTRLKESILSDKNEGRIDIDIKKDFRHSQDNVTSSSYKEISRDSNVDSRYKYELKNKSNPNVRIPVPLENTKSLEKNEISKTGTAKSGSIVSEFKNRLLQESTESHKQGTSNHIDIPSKDRSSIAQDIKAGKSIKDIANEINSKTSSFMKKTDSVSSNNVKNRVDGMNRLNSKTLTLDKLSESRGTLNKNSQNLTTSKTLLLDSENEGPADHTSIPPDSLTQNEADSCIKEDNKPSGNTIRFMESYKTECMSPTKIQHPRAVYESNLKEMSPFTASDKSPRSYTNRSKHNQENCVTNVIKLDVPVNIEYPMASYEDIVFNPPKPPITKSTEDLKVDLNNDKVLKSNECELNTLMNKGLSINDPESVGIVTIKNFNYVKEGNLLKKEKSHINKISRIFYKIFSIFMCSSS